MGKVYRALDLELDREVALKTLTSDACHGSTTRERFLREAQAAAKLRHPNIVRVYDVGEVDDKPFFTMELVEGGTLYDHSMEYRLPPPHSDKPSTGDETKDQSRTSQLSRVEYRDRQLKIATLMLKVARAVDHAHEHNIIHRDLKPGNILLEKGEPLVSDFGLARIAFVEQADSSSAEEPGEHRAHLTQAGTLLGTPAYMSPEQHEARPDVGRAADVWALGVTFYELLASRKPFGGKKRKEISRKARLEQPTPLRTINRHIDPGLETIVLRCLEKDLNREGKRYQTAGAVAADLETWLAGRAIERPSRTLREKLHFWPTTTAAAILVALAIGAIIFIAARDRTRPPQPADPLVEIEKELGAKGEVDLLPDGGLPRWSEWVFGDGSMPVVLDGKPSAISIKSFELGALALMPAVRQTKYELRARIKHEDGTGSPIAGIFFGHHEYPTNNGLVHFFVEVSFAEMCYGPNNPPDGFHADEAMGNRQLELNVRRIRQIDSKNNQDYIWAPLLKMGFPVRRQGDRSAWRDVAVQVSATDISLFWNRVQVGSVPWSKVYYGAHWMNDHEEMLDIPALASPSPGGGCGLLVRSAHLHAQEFKVITLQR
jgi:serine/threonine-protein kinase